MTSPFCCGIISKLSQDREQQNAWYTRVYEKTTWQAGAEVLKWTSIPEMRMATSEPWKLNNDERQKEPEILKNLEEDLKSFSVRKYEQ